LPQLIVFARSAWPDAPRPQQSDRQQHQTGDVKHRRRVRLAATAQTFFQLGAAWTFLARAVASQYHKARIGPITLVEKEQTPADGRKQSVQNRQRQLGQGFLKALKRLAGTFLPLM